MAEGRAGSVAEDRAGSAEKAEQVVRQKTAGSVASRAGSVASRAGSAAEDTAGSVATRAGSAQKTQMVAWQVEPVVYQVDPVVRRQTQYLRCGLSTQLSSVNFAWGVPNYSILQAAMLRKGNSTLIKLVHLIGQLFPVLYIDSRVTFCKAQLTYIPASNL